jgi:HSP20 family molecular chaperone IbpA
MIRSTLYHQLLTARPIGTSLACWTAVAKPASAAVLSGKRMIISDPRWFSTDLKERKDGDDELYNKSYSDAFDESDSLEKGKEELTRLRRDAAKKQLLQQQGKANQNLMGRRTPRRYNGPIYRHDIFGGFDDLWFHAPLNNPFFGPTHREDPFMDIMMASRFPSNSTMGDDSSTKLLRSSPGYDIKESDGQYEIAVHVPKGVLASDMTVDLEHDGTILHLSGARKVEREGLFLETRFHKRFTIGPNVDTNQMTANLSEDGVLVLTAPKLELEPEPEKTKHTIAISTTEKPYHDSTGGVALEEEVVQKSYSDEFDESDWVETGKVGLEMEQQWEQVKV